MITNHLTTSHAAPGRKQLKCVCMGGGGPPGLFGASAQSTADALGHPEGAVSTQGWPDLGTIRH